MIKIIVNGDEHEVPEGSILDLLHHFGLQKQWTIVEHNKVALARDLYDTTLLNEGDIVELVKAVAGG